MLSNSVDYLSQGQGGGGGGISGTPLHKLYTGLCVWLREREWPIPL